MDERTKKNAIGVGIIIVAGIGGIIYWQQQTIRQLTPSSPSFDQKAETKKNALNSLSIRGIVQKVSGSGLVVQATLVDLSKLDSVSVEPGKPLPSIQKTYTVSFNKNTVGKDFSFTEGLPVTVYASKPVYGLDSIVATRVDIMNAIVAPSAKIPAK